MFSARDWSTPNSAAEIAITRKVTAEDYVDANGACAASASASAPAEPAVGTVAGDLGTTTPASKPPPVAPGGVGLGMTECQVVQRAGQPNSVDIGSENNARKVVLTYSGGNWPGVYTFVDGRLKVVDQVAVPEQPKPVSKKRPAKPKSANRS